MWPFGNKLLQAKLRMPVKQAGTMYGMFAMVVVGRSDSDTLNGIVKASGERHFTGRFGKFACVARGEPTDVGVDFVISASAAGQSAADFHRELAAVLTERVAAFNAMLKQLQADPSKASAPAAQLVQ